MDIFPYTASRIIKTFRDCKPKPLLELLNSRYYEEPRKPGLGKFYDNSTNKSGKQSIENRLNLIRKIKHPWNGLNLNNDCIRVLLKGSFFKYYQTDSAI